MADSDRLHRFLFETLNIRGEVVQLEQSWQQVCARVDYPPLVRSALGDALAAATLLVATLKIEGTLTLQIRGDGPVHLLVVQVDSTRKVRGLARWRGELPEIGNNRRLYGSAQLVLTAEPRKGDRYQGIVELAGEDLQDALRAYFDLSEQLPTRLWLRASDGRLGGLLLQSMPGESDDADGWNRVVSLAETVTADELVNMAPSQLLHRLFHEEQLRLFAGTNVAFACSCNRDKIVQVLRQIGQQEVESILQEEGEVSVDCQFCAQNYRFDRVDAMSLFIDTGAAGVNKTLQ